MLDNSGYLITQWENCEKQAVSWFKKLVGTKRVLKVGKISAKNDTLTLQEKKIVPIGNKTNIGLEMTPSQRDI